jgi:hypothetical protein
MRKYTYEETANHEIYDEQAKKEKTTAYQALIERKRQQRTEDNSRAMQAGGASVGASYQRARA